MEFESVKKYLEQGGGIEDEHRAATLMSSLPSRFFENFILQHIHVDLIHPGRLVCSMKLPHQLANADNILHGGVIATLVDTVGSAALYTVGVCMDRVSVEINVSYLDAACAGEEIEIEAKVLKVGTLIDVISVDFREKNTRKLIAQGRHSMYIVGPSSKL
ncbi:Acyl-coenzyme A thioesterase 13 [Melia azedarach]|uniref:Acyl-coenzyme A thioesterase 13 n=1 Tax=Melia azedarach TaxID=155640 RepID=A0ACC1XVD5_MELAZ|nr:Acyl-coenzyme A thioesterase 13 [Melia azedarach]